MPLIFLVVSLSKSWFRANWVFISGWKLNFTALMPLAEKYSRIWECNIRKLLSNKVFHWELSVIQVGSASIKKITSIHAKHSKGNSDVLKTSFRNGTDAEVTYPVGCTICSSVASSDDSSFGAASRIEPFKNKHCRKMRLYLMSPVHVVVVVVLDKQLMELSKITWALWNLHCQKFSLFGCESLCTQRRNNVS